MSADDLERSRARAVEGESALYTDADAKQVAIVLEPMLQWFEFEHLPPHLKAASAPFSTLAHHIAATLPRNPERTVALRKLVEAKDCAVRAVLYKSG